MCEYWRSLVRLTLLRRLIFLTVMPFRELLPMGVDLDLQHVLVAAVLSRRLSSLKGVDHLQIRLKYTNDFFTII
jgi:hypothetical protein